MHSYVAKDREKNKDRISELCQSQEIGKTAYFLTGHSCRGTGFPLTDLVLFMLAWYKNSWLSQMQRLGKPGPVHGRIRAPTEKRNLTALWENEAKNLFLLELRLLVGEKENREKMYCFSQCIPVPSLFFSQVADRYSQSFHHAQAESCMQILITTLPW